MAGIALGLLKDVIAADRRGDIAFGRPAFQRSYGESPDSMVRSNVAMRLGNVGPS